MIFPFGDNDATTTDCEELINIMAMRLELLARRIVHYACTTTINLGEALDKAVAKPRKIFASWLVVAVNNLNFCSLNGVSTRQ